MDTTEFRLRGKEMIDYMCEYMETLGSRRVTPNVEPGYLKPLLPDQAPNEPESWENIMADVDSKIMPGVTHWQHPRFHAYFPSGNSYPSILGDMLSDVIGCIGFSWAASPACTELETIVLDWLGKAIGLPNEFLAFAEGSKGGGVIQTSASECVLVTMLAARAQAIKRLKQQHPFVEEGILLSKLMAYCSKEAHSCVEKAAMICFVKLRILEPDDKCSLRGATLRQVMEEEKAMGLIPFTESLSLAEGHKSRPLVGGAIFNLFEIDNGVTTETSISLFLINVVVTTAMEEDEAMGLIPFFVSTTLGTTSCCSFDNLQEIGPVCSKFPAIWLHVDAAYAGNAFICPELKHLLNGIHWADSFNTNLNKWMLVNFDCSTMWVRDRIRLTSALVVDPLYLQHGYSNSTIDYRHWGVPLSRRFRSLKIWFVMRSYGIQGLQAYVRHHCNLAKQFEQLVRKDARFEVCNEVKLGLVCFRLKGTDKMNEKLLSNINGSGKIHMVPASVHEKYVIRFCAVAQNASSYDVEHAWEVITEFASELLESLNFEKEQETDEVFELERKRKENLAYKRSFFVRMVSDPKIYNPKIAKTLPGPRRHGSQHRVTSSQDGCGIEEDTDGEEDDEIGDGNGVQVHTPLASWISWPLAFLFQNDDTGASKVPVRFRHLDTMVRLNTRRESNSRSSASPSLSPEGQDNSLSAKSADSGQGQSRSPRRSPTPQQQRKD